MSEDLEKPLTGANADAQPTPPDPTSPAYQSAADTAGTDVHARGFGVETQITDEADTIAQPDAETEAHPS